jgi:hypothetical protein
VVRVEGVLRIDEAQLPTVESVEPTLAPAAGGFELNVLAKGFDRFSDGMSLRIGTDHFPLLLSLELDGAFAAKAFIPNVLPGLFEVAVVDGSFAAVFNEKIDIFSQTLPRVLDFQPSQSVTGLQN